MGWGENRERMKQRGRKPQEKNSLNVPTGKKGKGKAENHEFLVVVVVTIVGRIGNGRYHTSFLDPATFSHLFHYLLALQQQVPRIPSSPTFQALRSTLLSRGATV